MHERDDADIVGGRPRPGSSDTGAASNVSFTCLFRTLILTLATLPRTLGCRPRYIPLNRAPPDPSIVLAYVTLKPRWRSDVSYECILQFL